MAITTIVAIGRAFVLIVENVLVRSRRVLEDVDARGIGA
jgi:hypothetical protein